MVSSITLDPYLIPKPLKFISSTNLKIATPPRLTELYCNLLNCGSRRNRLAGIEPIPVRFRNTGWGTRRRSFALVSIENVVIVTESCEMTVYSAEYSGL